jgi:threonine dehydratase
LLSGRVKFEIGARVAVILSGANVDPVRFCELLSDERRG